MSHGKRRKRNERRRKGEMNEGWKEGRKEGKTMIPGRRTEKE